MPAEDAYLFPSKRATGKPFAVEAPFKRLLQRAGLPYARLHNMRRTVGSTLAREERSAAEIATIVGHKTLEVVKRYSQISVMAKAARIELASPAGSTWLRRDSATVVQPLPLVGGSPYAARRKQSK